MLFLSMFLFSCIQEKPKPTPEELIQDSVKKAQKLDSLKIVQDSIDLRKKERPEEFINLSIRSIKQEEKFRRWDNDMILRIENSSFDTIISAQVMIWGDRLRFVHDHLLNTDTIPPGEAQLYKAGLSYDSSATYHYALSKIIYKDTIVVYDTTKYKKEIK